MMVYDTSIDKNTANEETLLLNSDHQQLQTNEVTVRKITFENGVFLRTSSIVAWVLITFLNLYLVYAFANGADI